MKFGPDCICKNISHTQISKFVHQSSRWQLWNGFVIAVWTGDVVTIISRAPIRYPSENSQGRLVSPRGALTSRRSHAERGMVPDSVGLFSASLDASFDRGDRVLGLAKPGVLQHHSHFYPHCSLPVLSRSPEWPSTSQAKTFEAIVFRLQRRLSFR